MYKRIATETTILTKKKGKQKNPTKIEQNWNYGHVLT